MRGVLALVGSALLAGRLTNVTTPSDMSLVAAAGFIMRAPAVAQLTFIVQPVTTPPGTTIKPPVRVGALDAQGNPASGFTGVATMTIGHNGAVLQPGKLSGTVTRAFVNGVATFSDLSIDQAGNGYTLKAAASGLSAAESVAFNVGAF